MLGLLLCAALSGLAVARSLNAEYGAALTVLGGVFGFVAGAVAPVLSVIIIAVTRDLFWQWWRPYPPPCESGRCRSRRDYRTVVVPEADRRIEGLSPVRWICGCGHVYAGGEGHGLQRRWVHVLPSGEIRLYLKHGFCGRWQREE